jgi:hypothetical protein
LKANTTTEFQGRFENATHTSPWSVVPFLVFNPPQTELWGYFVARDVDAAQSYAAQGISVGFVVSNIVSISDVVSVQAKLHQDGLVIAEQVRRLHVENTLQQGATGLADSFISAPESANYIHGTRSTGYRSIPAPEYINPI